MFSLRLLGRASRVAPRSLGAPPKLAKGSGACIVPPFQRVVTSGTNVCASHGFKLQKEKLPDGFFCTFFSPFLLTPFSLLTERHDEATRGRFQFVGRALGANLANTNF